MGKTEAKAIKVKAGEMKIIHSVSLHMPVFDSSFLFVDCGTRKLPQKISSRVRRLIPQYSMAENDPLNDLFASTALVLPDWLIFYDCLTKSLTSSIQRYKKDHGQDPSLLIVCHEVRLLLESKELGDFIAQSEIKFPFDHRTWYGIPIKEDRFDSVTSIMKKAKWFKLI